MKEESTIKKEKEQHQLIPLVAIGASAGGIEAAIELFTHLSHHTGMAYIYIQHLDANFKSKLSVILKRATVMKVYEAKHNMPLKPDTVYVIPPEKNMAIENGLLKLMKRTPNPVLNFPIDYCFSSLAANTKQAAIGILLSGASTDGVIGLKAIKAAGGISYVQDETALFQSMPQAAITNDVVDMILSPLQMAQELERLSKQKETISTILIDADEATSIEDEEDILDIIRLLKKSIGVDFSSYKRNTIKRRIVRRMLLHKLLTLKEYDQFLKQHINEVSALYKDLLINVTCFFRDTDTIEYLKKTVLPKVIASKSSSEPLRIWIPACSTGEEAYSMAMILFEILGTKSSNTSMQIFATDLSDHAIGKARLGLYSKNDLAEVSPGRIDRFFTKVDGHYRIIKAIRDICVFSPHNVFRDPPFSRMDLISCCNLFIYLEPVLQKKVIATFHYSLKPNAYLILGKSEALAGAPQLFTQLEKKHKVFKRKEASSKAFFDMTRRLPDTGNKDFVPFKKVSPHEKEHLKPEDFETNVDAILMQKFVPPSIIVNQELEILQFKGSTALFLEPPSGKATFSLLKMARHGLGFELRNIIHKANKSQQPCKKEGLQIERNGNFHTVCIEVVPLKNNNEERLFLVIFQETNSEIQVESKINNNSDTHLVKKLQNELETLKEDIRSIVEEQEVSNEELQSANEEIVSSNEELQSINEELETSKEEAESSNEELMTINQELQVRNDQLAESYEYAESVFTTIRESVLLLDKTLRIKNANRSFYNTFRLSESDTEDFLLYEVANGQWKIPELEQALNKILSGELLNIQSLEITHSFSQIGEKIMLVNIRRIIQKSHRNEVILLAIEDITGHKKGLQIIEERQQWFRNMADSSPVMIWVTNAEKQLTFFNKTWFEYTGNIPEYDPVKQWVNAIHPDDKLKFETMFDECFISKKDFTGECRIKESAGSYRWAMFNAKPTYSHHQKLTGYVGTIVDVHDQKMVSEALELRVKKRTKALTEANKNLERSNIELQQFAYVASHDLQEPLRKIQTFSNRLQTKFKQELSEEAAMHISKIFESSKRMKDLIGDLLNFSRATSAIELFEAVDLGDILKDVLKNLDLSISEKNIEVVQEGTLPLIMAVKVQMTQLFNNLLGNAVKFSSGAKSKICVLSHKLTNEELKIFHLNKSRCYYKISIIDNGIGFEQEYAEKIFTIFQRLNDKKDYPGTGIGLALCKKIVNYHEGIIYAESEKGKGATFEMILPLYFEK